MNGEKIISSLSFLSFLFFFFRLFSTDERMDSGDIVEI